MAKILHCADIHLDSPFKSGSVEKSEARRRELRGTFTSMMMYARDNGVDLVLMAGDIFDCAYVTRETVSVLVDEMKKAPGCRFVIAPGNHDPYTDDSVYAKTQFPPNVYIFKSESPSCFSFDDIGVDVYGYAFTSPKLKKFPFSSEICSSRDRLSILCAHADMTDPNSDYCPLTESELEFCGFDYAALGHIHASEGVKLAGKTCRYAYSGCLEGRDFGETGHKGAILIDAEKKDGELSFEARAVRFSRRRYEVRTLSVDGCVSFDEVCSKIKMLLLKQQFGRDTLLRLTLTGEVAPELDISCGALEKLFCDALFELEVRDETVPLYRYEDLLEDPTIKGAFFKALLPDLRGDDPEKRSLAARALKYGLAAIAGEDITQIPD